MTVVGMLDPWKLRERVETKTRKKADLISPTNSSKKKDELQKKKKEEEEDNDDKNNNNKNKNKKTGDDKKPKPPTESTVVLKIELHCDGCIQRIRKIIYKMKGWVWIVQWLEVN